MDGFVFSVYHNNPTQMTWTNLTLDVAEPNGEVLNDAIYNRNRKIEDRFNCKIETTEFTGIPDRRKGNIAGSNGGRIEL